MSMPAGVETPQNGVINTARPEHSNDTFEDEHKNEAATIIAPKTFSRRLDVSNLTRLL